MAEPLLELRGLHVHFVLAHGVVRTALRKGADVLRAVDGVDLEMAEGETLGLVGESGCGKSTLGRAIVGLYAPTSGTIRLAGKELGVKRQRGERRRVQMVFQDPYSSLNPRMSVRQMLGELLRVHGMVPNEETGRRCRELLALVGLGAPALDVYPHQLSGGQRQRVAIARALALEPEVLIADEPVSALDVSVQATVLNLLAELSARLGLTMLFISHNMAVVRNICERVAVMYLGRIVETAPTEELFSNARHPYTQALLEAVPRLTPGHRSEVAALQGDPPSPIRIPSGCRFRTRCPLVQPVCEALDPGLAAGGSAAHAAACHFAWAEPPFARPPPGADGAVESGQTERRNSSTVRK